MNDAPATDDREPKPAAAHHPAAPRASAAASSDGARRFARLAHKELREVLRDRRTIVTLVLMPLLLYPLLGLASRQFLLAHLATTGAVEFRIGVPSERQMQLLVACLRLGRTREVRGAGAQPATTRAPDDTPRPDVKFYVPQDLEAAVRAGDVHVGVRFADPTASLTASGENTGIDCEVLYLASSIMSARVLDYLDVRLDRANRTILTERLRQLGIDQRAEPIEARRVALAELVTGSRGMSLVALVPLVLILMTITGAVYPAIDLTAGERERGTLEVLVAAPVPRLALLLAKYVAVLTVSCLTAAVNLVMMTITGRVSGLGPLMFGEAGLSLTVVAQVAGLLVLFAAFFSAVLLAVSSFARSFKEAQAYLIPIMMAAIAPGMVSLMPEVRLSGLTSVAPLLNIVLLARDLVQQTAEPLVAAVVVFSTVLYALAAIAVAARVFGAEAVLYSADVGWRSFLSRRPSAAAAPSAQSALVCLALLFPMQFIASGMIAQLESAALGAKLVLAAGITAALFVLVPAIAARQSNVRLPLAFRLARPRVGAVIGAIVLAASLWPVAHELVVWQDKLGLATLSQEQLQRAAGLVEQLRAVPWWLVVLSTGVAVGVSEELFFRGYLFSALAAGRGPGAAVFYAGLLFGAFHLVTSDALAIERFLPTTFLGLVLGWVAWRAGSVWPSIVLHAAHNSLLLTMAWYSEDLKRLGIGLEERSDLPLSWLAASAIGIAAGAAIVYFTTRRRTP